MGKGCDPLPVLARRLVMDESLANPGRLHLYRRRMTHLMDFPGTLLVASCILVRVLVTSERRVSPG